MKPTQPAMGKQTGFCSFGWQPAQEKESSEFKTLCSPGEVYTIQQRKGPFALTSHLISIVLHITRKEGLENLIPTGHIKGKRDSGPPPGCWTRLPKCMSELGGRRLGKGRNADKGQKGQKDVESHDRTCLEGKTQHGKSGIRCIK